MSDKLLTRISALLAKAESTDSEHERDALIMKAQEIATANAISVERARQNNKNRNFREMPVQESILLFDPGDKSQTRGFFIRLWAAIAQQNDVIVNAYSDSSGVVVFGFREDISVVETLYASLSVQMVSGAEAYLKSGEHKALTVITETARGPVFKPLSGQQARRNFYDGFIGGISERLHRARQNAENEAQESTVGTDLVLRAKHDEVAEFYSAHSQASGSYGGGQSQVMAAEIMLAGRDAAHRASLATQHALDDA